MTAKRGLGKGLGAIFGEDVVRENKTNYGTNVSRETSEHQDYGDQKEKAESKGKQAENEVVGKEYFLKLSQIEPNSEQPRKNFDAEQIRELADSIRKYGVLQPLLVQKKNDHYEIIAGERRWRAAKEAGIKEVPVVIKEYSRQQAMEISLIENIQRTDLNPVEEAQAYQKLIRDFGLTQEEIAERVSKNRATITNSIRLLKLDKRVQEMLVQNQISGGHARALLVLDDGEMQYQTALKIISGRLSVREVEKLVKSLGRTKNKKKEKLPEDKDIGFVFRDLEERLKQAMGTKVTINRRDSNKGKIEIEYYSQAELERIVELLESFDQTT